MPLGVPEMCRNNKTLAESGFVCIYRKERVKREWYRITQLRKNVPLQTAYSESFCRIVLRSIPKISAALVLLLFVALSTF